MMECSDRLSWKAQMREFPQRETPMGDDDMDDHSQGGRLFAWQVPSRNVPKEVAEEGIRPAKKDVSLVGQRWTGKYSLTPSKRDVSRRIGLACEYGSILPCAVHLREVGGLLFLILSTRTY